ncbi:MAG: SUMF1/EgtB/PvdO family nonheme iron enzyme [Bacteroidetes bacterium]|nr:SUMF1/EgtB/PvdO family nonheme iron enzyme [Bacteroidota bacterium]
MGKTTFLMNLFHDCTTSMNGRNQNFSLEFFSLANPSALERIAKIENQGETVLFLDGFDEDAQSVVNFRERFNEIYTLSKNFAKVIMTSRKGLVSFYESQTFEEYLLGSDEGKAGMVLSCVYIPEMSVQDVAEYVAQSYSHKEKHKRRKVTDFIKQSHLLVGRPVLLSYVEELMLQNREYSFAYEMYETLVNSWIEKEELIFDSSQKQWSAKEERKAFYRALSVAIHRKQRELGGLSLDKKELTEVGLAHSLNLQAFESSPNSMISYFPEEEEFRFTHRLIWEYFLAKEALENPDFLVERPFYGKEKALEFFQRMTLNLSMAKLDAGVHIWGNGEETMEIPVGPFYMDKFPVKVSDYRRFCEDSQTKMPKAPSWGWEDDAPMVNISWIDAMNYCRWLSTLTGLSYRLPTVAEWEYAALGGAKFSEEQKYAGGELIDSLAWYSKNADRKTHPVGEKQPNQIGIFDLYGNVWEWCQPEENGPDEIESTMIKGGSWVNSQSDCQITSQGKLGIEARKNMVGFRVVISG